MRTKILILGLICLLIMACESPYSPTPPPPLPLDPPPPLPPAANVVFDGVLICGCRGSPQWCGTVTVQGEIDNIGNATATNILIHARLFDSEDNEIWYGTYLFIHGYCDCSRMEPSWSRMNIDISWQDIPYEICSQVGDFVVKTDWVEITWDNGSST